MMFYTLKRHERHYVADTGATQIAIIIIIIITLSIQYNAWSSKAKLRDRCCPVYRPQCSQIGPLLFILFINDLTKHVESCEMSLYADNSTIQLRL